LQVGNAGYARQLVDQVNVSVVRQKNSIVGPLGRIQRDQHQRRVVDFCTVTPQLFTSAGSCDCACDTRSCARTWSIFASVPISKLMIILMSPVLALIEYM